MNALWILGMGGAGLLVALLLGLVRAAIGPSLADRMLSVQLVGTIGVGLLVLLAAATGVTAYFDVAIILGLLAATTVVAMTRLERAND